MTPMTGRPNLFRLTVSLPSRRVSHALRSSANSNSNSTRALGDLPD